MAFTINKDLIFIDSMQFMNSSLGKLLIKFSYHDVEYLAQEFDSEKLMRKDDYPDEQMHSFEGSSAKKIKTCFYRSLEDGTNGNIGEKLNYHIIDEEYLACIII